MALQSNISESGGDLFRLELVNQINMRHPLVLLADVMDWEACETHFAPLYAAGVGRPGYRIRLMVGLQYLKQMHNVSDEVAVNTWVENPYWQYFCGEHYFQHELPIDPSLMTGFRKRIGAEGCEFIFGLTMKVGIATKTVSAASMAVVNVDTTVQEKAVAFPTDARLLHKARRALVREAVKCGIKLRQSYERVGAKTFAKSARLAHGKKMRQAQGQNKRLKTMLGAVMRDVLRKANEAQMQRLERLLAVVGRIHSQPRRRAEGDPPKVYSVHAPEVECIGKGKVHKPYEFGVKVGVVSTSKESFVIGMKALHGNPFDGHTLKECLNQAQMLTQVPVKEVYADKGYRGHGLKDVKVWLSGAKRGVTMRIKNKLKRRNAIEPVIGHMKSDGRLGRNFLKGVEGDQMNALLCAAGHNLRKVLQKLRLFYAHWLDTLTWAIVALLLQAIKPQLALTEK